MSEKKPVWTMTSFMEAHKDDFPNGVPVEDRGHDIRYRPRTASDGEWFLEAECACGWVKPFDPIDGWVSEAVLATACVRHRMYEEGWEGE